MTPREYEQALATLYRSQGYEVDLGSGQNDWGVDAFASKGGERLAIQAKMYGHTARRINREMVMQLHGAKDYFDCTHAAIVTDGELTPDAQAVADKLGIQVVHFLAAQNSQRPAPPPEKAPDAPDDPPAAETHAVTFDDIWTRYIVPLAGTTLESEDGLTNTIVSVDWSGIHRVTSNGLEQFIKIEIFRQTIGHLLKHGLITRDEINTNYKERASSGIVLILSQVPLFERQSNPIRLLLRPSTPLTPGT